MYEKINNDKITFLNLDSIILEFIIAKDSENLEEKAQLGKEQIKEKEYYKELVLDKVENIKNYSIAFQGKKCKVIG